MSIWEQFVRSLLTSGDTPKMFSLFHVVGFVIVVLLGVGLVFLSKYKIQNNPLAYKITVLVFWGIILIFEILKQITFSYSIKNNQLVVDYNWIGFPFQFCSTPLYILPLIGFLKPNIFRKRLELFGSIFFLMGGMMGITFASFTYISWMNFQTLIHHGFMLLSAILLLLQNKQEFKIVKFFQCLFIYLGLLVIAIVLNAIVPPCVPCAVDAGFNMFFISWHSSPGIPVIKELWNAVPYPVYFIVFLTVIVVVAFIVYVIFSAIVNHRVDFDFHKAMVNRKKIYLARAKTKKQICKRK